MRGDYQPVRRRTWRKAACRARSCGRWAAAAPIAASANNLAKAGYALGFGGLSRTKRPAGILVALAVLGFAAAAAYLV